ncbi:MULTISPECIES: biotin--[acetyl-CoA-carboxylase] ligase [Anaerococcus]|jgi:biotin--[acetyl-coA-carboxylase] ligase|uniref:biotin--[acetyl-CoA-carboxylase] ligase n=1 Tax=Anaerococcus TaxID=165779 RepID=UPI001AE63CF9|nr:MULTISPECIES: biotin--[acetyl-CoA-carboxylase] ligase [Anaerococcus]MBP2070080.1 BirA family biotin operon repressor/biotin-[acetyl-CoA-carboxylase] ligase [Anaerococcus nagyae]MDU1828014.1 biotin--[acetyl-CoA-carboxylase] ligase [Anaerococcus sp.]MDU1864563.1 biotin--[acetyl-CoA-carboxylase] ligase [Anaerococcus sp.]MDU3210788.1 biotin--[acetyl-CoA-carboxylase] ligase [Anaerococcus sp.]
MSQILENNIVYLLKSNEINRALDLVIDKTSDNQLNTYKVLSAKLMMLLGQLDRFNEYIKKVNIKAYFSKGPSTYMYYYMYYSLVELDYEKREEYLDKFEEASDLLNDDQYKIETILKDLTDEKLAWMEEEEHLESVESTNTYMKGELEKGHKVRIVTADEQIAGKGQKDHLFVSPKGGLYISLNIKVPDSDLVLVTSQAGVLVAKSLKKISDEDIKIKWLNDLYIDDKKFAGILCESAVDCKGHAQYTIVGIGINLVEESPIPENLKEKMTTLLGKEADLSTRDIIENVKYYVVPAIFSMQEGICHTKLLEKYNELIAKKDDLVTVYNESEEISGVLVGLDENLDVVLNVDGEEKSFSYGYYRLKFNK